MSKPCGWPSNRITNRAEHFMNYVTRTAGCWFWKGALSGKKYGSFWNGKRAVKAHRFSYEIFRGPIPAGLSIDHLCRNKICVNPAHLEAVPIKINILRGECPPAKNAVALYCKHGHELSIQNVVIDYRGWRTCRACRIARDRERRRRKAISQAEGKEAGK